MSQKLIIKSTDKSDTPADIEDKLEKALGAIKIQRENKQFTDVYLKQRKDEADVIMKKVFSNMMEEISKILQ